MCQNFEDWKVHLMTCSGVTSGLQDAGLLEIQKFCSWTTKSLKKAEENVGGKTWNATQKWNYRNL